MPFTWLKRWFGRGGRFGVGKRNKQPRRHLCVEALESRVLPSFATLASFDSTHGSNPMGTLVADPSGDLFGTTQYGGASGDGTVFEVAAGSGTITTLASFTGTNGQLPQAGVIIDGNGNLFGTTFLGGTADKGTVFEVAAGSNTITTLASFNGSNGADPQGGLLEDANGNLIGTTESGGASSRGTVFEVPAGGGIVTLASLNANNGADPVGGLFQDTNGNLFGTTRAGGTASDGTVFELSRATITWTNPGSGNWDVPGNWSTGTVPGNGETAVIDTAAAVTVTVQAGDAIQVQAVTCPTVSPSRQNLE